MIARLAAIIAFVLIASAAQAQSTIWTSVGTACVPDGATVGHYATGSSAASVHFAGNDTGTLTFTCSIARVETTSTNWVLRLSYRDPNGMGSNASVVANFYKLHIGNFSPVLIASVSSNESSATGNNIQNSNESFTNNFNFDTNIYFVQVVLTRANSSQNVQFHSITIEEK